MVQSFNRTSVGLKPDNGDGTYYYDVTAFNRTSVGLKHISMIPKDFNHVPFNRTSVGLKLKNNDQDDTLQAFF